MKYLKLKNSLTNSIKEIKINKKKEIKIYLCGPTVYDNIHIGNIRPSLIFDVLIRTLEENKIKYKYAQNITDIDDKIIERSEKEDKTETQISLLYTKEYIEIFKKLNLKKPKFYSVTKNIKGIISFVGKIIKNGDGYILKENILFNIKKNIKKYGELSNNKIEKLLLNSSSKKIKKENIIENEKDFVLWKKTNKGLNWNSPWFSGRPGWHTECVYLIEKIFKKKTIDIHGGGKDLLFPHHENERIQFISLNKKELSKIWIHFGHIKIEDEKMSKSLKNFITVKDFIIKYNPNILKLLILNTNYNEDIEISENIIKQSCAQIEKIKNILKKINLFLYSNKIEKKNLKQKSYKKKEILELLLNNLQLTKVFFILEKCISFINKEINKKDNLQNKNEIKNKINDFFFILKIIGFDFKIDKEYTKKIKKNIDLWKNLILKNKFKKADEAREKLQKKNII